MTAPLRKVAPGEWPWRRRVARRPLAAAVLALALASLPSSSAAQGPAPDSVALVWTAPGDDGDVGTAATYDLRFSTTTIDAQNWASATPVAGLPAPLPAGSRQRAVVRGLTPGTVYYFALRTADEAGNWSELSNVMRLDWTYDTAPPAAPQGVGAELLAGGSVRLAWAANGDADLAGYVVYRATASGGPFTALTASPIQTTSYVDDAVPAGAGAVWYQVAARDASGNESARSATVSVVLPIGPASWGVRSVGPNPSAPGRPARFRIDVPAGGGAARLEIVNSGGQRVRRIELGTLVSGTTTIEWDGRNDAGREVAPGAYTGWLIAGSSRAGIRLVRLP